MTNRTPKTWFLLAMVALLLLVTSCGRPLFQKKNNCGCPNKKGMVGY